MRPVALLVLLALAATAVPLPSAASCPAAECVPLDSPQGDTLTGAQLRLAEVRIGAAGGLMVTEVALHLANPAGSAASAHVAIPLPRAAALTAFNLTVDGAVWEGVVLESGRAQRTYDEAASRGEDAVLLRQATPTRLALDITIPAGAERVLRAEWVQPIERAGLERLVRLPTALLASASEVDIEVRLDGASEAQAHGLALPFVPSGTGVTAHARLPPPAEGSVVTYRDADAWTASVTLSGLGEAKAFASVCPPAAARVARDVVFVLDRSGSMQGTKMVAAREALVEGLEGVRDGDRYAVVLFDDVVEATSTTLSDPAKTLAADQRTVARTEARRSTDIDAGLQRALAILGGEDARPAMVVLLTDGLPTSGVTEHAAILDRLEVANARSASVHVVPIGLDADQTFLADIALRTGGAYLPFRADDPLLGDRIVRMLDTVADVVAHDLRMEVRGIPGATLLPRSLPSLTDDGCLQVAFDGAFDAAASFDLVVSGVAKDGPFDRTFPFQVRDLRVNPAVATLWGKAYVDDMLSTERVEGVSLRQQIVENATRLKVASPYTSWLIVKPVAPAPTPSPSDSPGGAPVPSPTGTSFPTPTTVPTAIPTASPTATYAPSAPYAGGDPQPTEAEEDPTPGPAAALVLAALAAAALAWRRRD